MSEIHDFDDTVVAVLSEHVDLDATVADLAAAGYEAEVIRGEEGKRHLDPAGEEGVGATLKRLISAFGDQYRVMERLTDELDAGRVVISVDATPDEATRAVRILQERGGEFIWKLGTWTFTQVAE
jgi:hypothetical protein